MKVTAQQILDLLPIVADRKWEVADGVVRDVNDRCPICALVNEIDETIDCRIMYARALRSIDVDVSLEAFDRIAGAADQSTHSLRPALINALEI